MKTIHKSILLLLCAATVSSCGDNAVQNITVPAAGSFVKFHNFAVGAPSVNFFSDGTKMTGISSTSGAESATGTAYPAAGANGVANGGFYSAIAPGAHVLSGVVPATATTNAGLTISTANATLETGKYYSYFQSGIYSTTSKTSDAFVIEDPFISAFDYTVAYVRLVNASSNSQPLTLYAKSTAVTTPPQVEAAVGGAVAYKAGGAFVALPPGSYDLNARVTGSSANAVTKTAVSLLAGRTYTVTALGDMTLPTTGTAATRPVFNVTANR
jgi:hypothetical protein